MIDTELLQGLRVLLVDDDLVDRMVVVRALKQLKSNIEVVERASALAALEALKTSPFDCLISDLEMPGHDGKWLLEQAKAGGFDVPFVALTGHGDEQIAVSLMKAGAVDYVSKGSFSAELFGHVLSYAVRVHRAERDARLSRERLHLALHAAHLGTWDVDLCTMSVRCDDRCRKILGYQAGEAIQIPSDFERIHPDDRARVQAAMHRAFAGDGDGKFLSEHRLRLSGGSQERWVCATGQTYFRRGRAVRFVGAIQDVTQRKEAESAIQRRIEFEQQLIGIVSHDLRNPISAMMLGASAIHEEVSGGSNAALAAQRILSSGQRATRLIRDLLDFTQARLGSGLPLTLGPANIHTICQHVLEEFQLSHPNRMTHCRQGAGDGHWDADRVAQIVGNLLRNAISYSPPQSRVEVTSSSDGHTATVEVTNHNLDGPIPADVLPTLFLPFKRGKPSRDGERSIGLGLYIVHELVRAHGGSVDVRSDASGTCFRVTLPTESPAEGSTNPAN